MPTRAQLKESARKAMRSTKPNVMLIAMVYFIIVFITVFSLTILNNVVLLQGMNAERIVTMIKDGELSTANLVFIIAFILTIPNYVVLVQGVNPNRIATMITDWERLDAIIIAGIITYGGLRYMTANQIIWLVVSVMIMIAIFVLTMMMEFGIISVCLNVCRFKKAGFGSLFSPFTMFFKLCWLKILMSIYVWLWSILFIIPGIIAKYRYSMAVYILLDNPELSASECIRRSKEMMAGKKFELFILNLSFIGWVLLSSMPNVSFIGWVLLSGMPNVSLGILPDIQTTVGWVILAIVAFAGMIVSLYVLPYMETTIANFYNAISGYITEADNAVINDRRPCTIAVRPSPVQGSAQTADKHEDSYISLCSASDGIADRAQPKSISTQELASGKIHMQSGKDASAQLPEDEHLPQIVIKGKFKTGEVREWKPKDFPCFIGRNSFVAQIAVPDSCASRIHARLYIESGILTITDEGATNGTIVNSKKISAPTQLSSGDQVTIGETILCFEISEH